MNVISVFMPGFLCFRFACACLFVMHSKKKSVHKKLDLSLSCRAHLQTASPRHTSKMYKRQNYFSLQIVSVLTMKCIILAGFINENVISNEKVVFFYAFQKQQQQRRQPQQQLLYRAERLAFPHNFSIKMIK